MRRGITILELLVVIVLCVLVAGVGVVALVRHRESSHRVMCENNLRVLGSAVLAYHGTAKDKNPRLHLPPSRIAEGYSTWAVLIAPHMLADHPLNRWDLEQSFFAQEKEVREARTVFHFCPSRIRSDTLSQSGDLDSNGEQIPGGLGDYANVAGDGSPDRDWTSVKANGALLRAEVLERKGDRIVKWQSLTRIESLKRGASNVLLLGEKHVPIEHQGDASMGDGTVYSGQHPACFSRIAGPGFPITTSPDAPFNRNFGSAHHRICNFLMADGSTRPTTIDISEGVLGELAQRGD